MTLHPGSAAALALTTCLSLTSAPALARPGGWYDPMMGGPMMGAPRSNRAAQHADDREGRITVATFVAEGAARDQLGHGVIEVTSHADGSAYVPSMDRSSFEAAMIDQLIHSGYDTIHAGTHEGQLAELRIARREIEPAEAKRSPVSGQASMGVSNHGSAYGLAIAVDLTKPRSALVSTRLEARILDRTTGNVLWEGRAEVATREGDESWSEQTIALRLAEALFDGFPNPVS